MVLLGKKTYNSNVYLLMSLNLDFRIEILYTARIIIKLDQQTRYPMNELHQFYSVQLLSCVRLFATPRIAARQASLSI